MQPKFNAPQGGYDSELLCPKCGGNYLRHDKVEVFERGEDQATAVHVTVEDGKAVLDQSLVGNPSARRHGLLVHFWCEGCSARTALSLYQHKGNTFMDFKFTEET